MDIYKKCGISEKRCNKIEQIIHDRIFELYDDCYRCEPEDEAKVIGILIDERQITFSEAMKVLNVRIENEKFVNLKYANDNMEKVY